VALLHDTETNMTKASKDFEPAKDAATHPSRRTFIRAATTIAAGSVALGNLSKAVAAPEAPDAPPSEQPRADTAARGDSPSASQPDRELRRTQWRVRATAAQRNFELPIAPHPTNGDEDRYANKIGSDTRGLPHDQLGEVDPVAWQTAIAALESRSWEQLEAITLGGTRKLVNPIGTLAASLEGQNVTQVLIPPAPAIASEERAAEAIEQYWQAVLRDVSYSEFEQNADAQAASAELSKLPAYTGPREAGIVTPRILFRGSVRYSDPSDPSGRAPKHVIPPGVLEGPSISQFAFRDVPYGTQRIAAVSRVPVKGQHFLIDYDEWLAVQDGAAATRTIEYEAGPRYLSTVRDLNEYTHGGNPLFWGAVLQLAAAASGSATEPAGIGAPRELHEPLPRGEGAGERERDVRAWIPTSATQRRHLASGPRSVLEQVVRASFGAARGLRWFGPQRRREEGGLSDPRHAPPLASPRSSDEPVRHAADPACVPRGSAKPRLVSGGLGCDCGRRGDADQSVLRRELRDSESGHRGSRRSNEAPAVHGRSTDGRWRSEQARVELHVRQSHVGNPLAKRFRSRLSCRRADRDQHSAR
jgi:hypothetical protein